MICQLVPSYYYMACSDQSQTSVVPGHRQALLAYRPDNHNHKDGCAKIISDSTTFFIFG